MKFAFVCVFLVIGASSQAERLPLAQRVSLSERAPKHASSVPVDHTWKLGLLGLAVLSFLIRKRL